MKATLISGRNALLAGLLGTAFLIAAPAASQTTQEKWWTPREGGRARVERPQVRQQKQYRTVAPKWKRGEQRVWRQVPRYGRFYRDRVVIYDGYRGPRYPAYRYWFRPQYYRHYVYVRPVRYWTSIGLNIAGVSISARFHDRDRYWYGCNFCDARFDHYDDWSVHVRHCDHGPDGYMVKTGTWDDDWDRYHDDRGWYEEDGRYYDER